MKQLFFILLLGISCFGQEKKHLTAYRMAHLNDDGPCSVVTYVEYGGNTRHIYFSYVSDESNDQQLIRNLLSIKNLAHGWESRPHYCCNTTWGDYIENMMVIKGSGSTDTLFTNYNNQWIIFPSECKAFFDKQGLLTNALTGNIKDFFEYDFRRQIYGIFDPKDSVSVDRIVFKKQL